jgi:hypothetical protein
VERARSLGRLHLRSVTKRFSVVARSHAVRRDDDVVEILARARRRPAPGRLFLPEAPF